jgi:anti-sigma B factor antagonist
MKVERKRWENVTILSFVGEFDAFNLPTYSQRIDALVDQGEANMVFNLRLLTFINSSALGYLLKVKKRCQELGGDLILVSPSKFIKKTLLTLGLQEVFGIYDSDEDGVLSFQKPLGAKKSKISKGDAETDDKMLGANSIFFRVVDEEGKDLFGQVPQVGRIANLTENSLEIRYQIPAPGNKFTVPISSDTFDGAVHPGTRMRLKFRQPFAMKAHYFETGSLVRQVSRGEGEAGAEAVIAVDYQDMKPEDKAALSGFVQDLKRFREILAKSGDQV